MKAFVILIVILSTSAQGHISIDLSNSYLNEDSVSKQKLSYEGILERAYAVGGETTGVVIRTDDNEIIELKGKDSATHKKLETLALNRSFAKVLGHYITVRGVEIPVRKVFKVVAIMVE